jgi:hypothetical protein
MSFPYFDETRELNDTTRKGAGGSFIALPDGVTHYELCGDENGIPVVLTPGFLAPYFIFDHTFDFLVRNGFRVLRYDLFGRGFSDRPAVPYGIELFVHQLRDLLDAMGFRQVDLLDGWADHSLVYRSVWPGCRKAHSDRPVGGKARRFPRPARSGETARGW